MFLYKKRVCYNFLDKISLHKQQEEDTMADNSQSTTLLPSDYNMSPRNTIEQEWKHLLTCISEKIRRQLYGIAIFNILIGIVIIGLDIGLMINGDIT